MSTITLTDEQLHKLADLVAERLMRADGRVSSDPQNAARASGLVDVRTVSQALGVSEWFVREHADELGVVRVGGGAKKRLRFDLERAISRYSSEGSQTVKHRSGGSSQPKNRRSPSRWPIDGRNEGHVLQIRGAR